MTATVLPRGIRGMGRRVRWGQPGRERPWERPGARERSQGSRGGAGRPGEPARTAHRRSERHPGSRVSPRSPAPGRNPAPDPAPGRGSARPGGVPAGRGMPAAADQPDHPAAILLAGRASRRAKSRSPRAGFVSGRLSSPHRQDRAGGMADAESSVSAGGVRGSLRHSFIVTLSYPFSVGWNESLDPHGKRRPTHGPPAPPA